MAYKLGDDERLDYGIDWSPETIAHARSIVSSAWVVPAELTKVSDAADADSTSITIETNVGSVVGQTYEVTNIVTFNDADSTRRELSLFFVIVERKTK